MDFDLSPTFVKEYDRTWRFLYQQEVGMLDGTTQQEPQASEKKAWTFIAPTQGIVDRALYSESANIAMETQRTWVTMHTWTWSKLVEEIEVIKSLSDPSSAYLKNAVQAAHRYRDEAKLAGLGAVVYRGKEGVVPVNWYDVGECIGINGDGTATTAGAAFTNTTETGLTLAKIFKIGAIMDNNNVPAGDRHLVANVDQKWFLLSSARATSRDYATIQAVSALTNGQIPNNEYAGLRFHWLPSDRFTVNATDTGCYECYAYHKDAVMFTTGMDMKTRLTEESKSNYAVRVFAETMFGVGRLQGKGVVPILLAKTPAPDFTQA